MLEHELEIGHKVPQNEDGGTRAWCTIFGGWLAQFATASAFGVYQDFYTRAGTSSSSNVSWIGSTQLFFLIVLGLPTGAFLDRGYFKPVVLTGSIIYLLSLFMLSLCRVDRYYQIFLSQGIGMGIGSGLIYIPSMAVQAHHWRTRRALAMGVVITGSSIGGFVYPIVLNNFFHGSVGFAWGARTVAFINLFILIVANCLMSPRSLNHFDSDPGSPTVKPKPISPQESGIILESPTSRVTST